ncbi:MAG: hypothetical protein WC455_14250 [Dehalococcoidia bacterium]|jgi:hypothetical protein
MHIDTATRTVRDDKGNVIAGPFTEGTTLTLGVCRDNYQSGPATYIPNGRVVPCVWVAFENSEPKCFLLK